MEVCVCVYGCTHALSAIFEEGGSTRWGLSGFLPNRVVEKCIFIVQFATPGQNNVTLKEWCDKLIDCSTSPGTKMVSVMCMDAKWGSGNWQDCKTMHQGFFQQYYYRKQIFLSLSHGKKIMLFIPFLNEDYLRYLDMENYKIYHR